MSTPFRRRTRPEARRAQIRDAIIAVVSERGYLDTTLQLVCDRAGIAAAEFERHFADVEDCYCQLIEEERNEVLRRAGVAFAAEACWRDAIRASAYALFGYLMEDVPRARFVFVEVMAAGERAQLIRDQGMELLFALIDQGRYELEDPDAVSWATAAAIGGSIYNQMQLAVERDHLTLDLVPRLLYNVVFPYLGAEAAKEELLRAPPESPRVEDSRSGRR
jgi:AcrR family transcriptional regulator